jgi:hypothetical protein
MTTDRLPTATAVETRYFASWRFNSPTVDLRRRSERRHDFDLLAGLGDDVFALGPNAVIQQ